MLLPQELPKYPPTAAPSSPSSSQQPPSHPSAQPTSSQPPSSFISGYDATSSYISGPDQWPQVCRRNPNPSPSCPN